MRISQAAINMNWFKGSNNPGQSLYAYVCGAPSTELIDDQSLGTTVNPLEASEIDSTTGLVLYAKDADTLRRGLQQLSKKFGSNTNFTINSKSGGMLAVSVISWSVGTVRHQSKAAAALLTIVHNAKARLTHKDYIQSVRENVNRVSRDGLLIQRGAALLVHTGTQLTSTSFGGGGVVTWLGTHTKGGTTMTMESLNSLLQAVLRH